MPATTRQRAGSDADAVRAAQTLVAMAHSENAGGASSGAAAGAGARKTQAQTLPFRAPGCGSPGCEGEVVGCALYCAACIARARAASEGR